MIYGFDIDDTSGCFSDLLFLYARKFDKTLRNTGIVNPCKYILREMFDWSEEEKNLFIELYIEMVATNMAPKAGAVKVIRKLKEEGNIIKFISARSYKFYKDPYGMTYNWLNGNDIPYDKVILEASNKAEICKSENVDVFMDDIPSVCNSVVLEGIKTYLFSSLFNSDYVISKVSRMDDWYKFYEMEGKCKSYGR